MHVRLHHTIVCPLLFRLFILSFPAFPQTGAEKAATIGGRTASEPTRWSPHTLPQGAPPGAAQDPGPPTQRLFFEFQRPPCETGVRLFRPACRGPGPGISGTGNVNVTWPLLKGSSPCSICGFLSQHSSSSCRELLWPHGFLDGVTSGVGDRWWVRDQMERMLRWLVGSVLGGGRGATAVLPARAEG